MTEMKNRNADLISCTYMTDGVMMPFCKGCGHTHILRKLDDALHKLNLNPKDVCFVTDIGCIGLTDALFDKVHTVHTTHGRSTAFATGIALADSVLASKKLKTIVLIGDGGSMIGLLHIVNAALLNTDVTCIVANNFLFGMTGGQQSSFSPIDFITQTTPEGNMIPPIDICKVVDSCKAGFTARKISTDKDLPQVFADAISFDGFSLVEVLELCTEHATVKNDLKGNALADVAKKNEHELGNLKNDSSRKEFGKAYLEKFHSQEREFNLFSKFIEQEYDYYLKDKLQIIVAGSAGEKVQSSAGMLCQSAVKCGLFVTQKNDNPVTQGTGFSLSEVIISPHEIYFTAADSPDAVIIVSEDGLKECRRQKIFERVSDKTFFVIDESIELPFESNKVIKKNFRKICTPSKAAICAVEMLVEKLNPFPIQALKTTFKNKYGDDLESIFARLHESENLA